MMGLPIIATALVAALAILLAVPATRRLLRSALNLIPALALFIVGLAAHILWKPVTWLVARVPFLARAADAFGRGIERLGTRKAGLASGDRAAVARELWPEDRFPFLYCDDVPEDIRRPLWEDGRLIGGQDITWLADRHFSAGHAQAAGRLGVTAALVALIVQPAVLLLRKSAGQAQSAAPVMLEQFPGEEPVYVSGWDIWQTVAADALQSLASGAAALIGLIAAWLLVALGIGLLVAIAAIEHWRSESAAPYEQISKDAHVRWHYRAESRALAHTGYLRQVAHATGFLQGTPLFRLGEGTGTFRLRGDLAAPVRGQALALDRESLFQHLLVFGGTGDGKTTAILKPLLQQVLAQPQFGAYITDAKGVLWRDAEAIAGSAGRSGDVLRIGTGADDLGVNITASLAPHHVAAVLRSVLAQTGGAAGDSFWPDMAANLMRHALTIGRAYAATSEGKAEARRLNPYSLWWAYQAVLDEKRIIAACDAIAKADKQCLADMDAARADNDQDALM